MIGILMVFIWAVVPSYFIGNYLKIKHEYEGWSVYIFSFIINLVASCSLLLIILFGLALDKII